MVIMKMRLSRKKEKLNEEKNDLKNAIERDDYTIL